jgi:hypothetical protein
MQSLAFTLRGRALAVIGTPLPVVGQLLAIVCDPLALIGDPLPSSGERFASCDLGFAARDSLLTLVKREDSVFEIVGHIGMAFRRHRSTLARAATHRRQTGVHIPLLKNPQTAVVGFHIR